EHEAFLDVRVAMVLEGAAELPQTRRHASRRCPGSYAHPIRSLVHVPPSMQVDLAPGHRTMSKDLDTSGFRHLAVARRDGRGAARPRRRRWRSRGGRRTLPLGQQDRKSTRLNSSHEWISYAVF